jgi:hypothetical protein
MGLFTLGQAAREFGLSVPYLRRLVKESGIGTKAGPRGCWLFDGLDMATLAFEVARRASKESRGRRARVIRL